MSQYPSWRREYRRQKYLKEVQRVGRTAINAKKREYYRKNKAQISQRLKQRYATDPEYREKMKKHSREFYDCPGRIERAHQLRKNAYWKEPERHRKAASAYYHGPKWELNKAKNAERRARNRERNRAHARNESMLLTDSYVRNQLSKYSEKSTNEWTEAEVDAKRQVMINNRCRRVTAVKAAQIRTLYGKGQTADQIAKQFKTSVSNVFYILANRGHYDPAYTATRILNFSSLSKTLQMINGAAELAKYGQQ